MMPRGSGSLMMSSSSQSHHPSSSDIFPLHILGGGSIGLLYASGIHSAYCNDDARRLHDNDSPHPVTLLMRSHHKPHLRKSVDASCYQHWFASVEVCKPSSNNINEEYDTRNDIPVELIGETHDDHPINSVLLCTKANDAISALDSIWNRLLPASPPSTPAKVIILSNGALAIRDAIYDHFGYKSRMERGLDKRVEIILATTTHGAYKTLSSRSAGRFSVTHAGEGSTHCTDDGFIQICQSSGWKRSIVLSELDMHIMLWKKLAVNCVINPITALHNVRNGELLHEHFKHDGKDIKVVVRHILEEVSRVSLMEMEKLLREDAGTAKANSATETMKTDELQQLSAPFLEMFVFKVMSDTAHNISSMLQDVRANRTTEIQYLNGYVASKGQECGIDCSHNLRMLELVEELLP